MSNDWDERAKKDAFYYIASWNKSWDPERFFESGEVDYRALVEPVLATMGFVPAEKAMLEIGCGVGRMTRAFSTRFARVFALDISQEMLSRAKALHRGVNNIVWVRGDGLGLSMIDDQSVDLVFSYLVFQHLPTKDLVRSYVREILRVLKPGGVFLFQFNSCHGPTMNWRGRAAWGLIDRMREPILGLNLRVVGDRLASLLRLDPLAAGHSWRGAVMDASLVAEPIVQHGGMIVGVVGEGTPMTWCYGRKLVQGGFGAPSAPAPFPDRSRDRSS